jgi:hypothetical protein
VSESNDWDDVKNDEDLSEEPVNGPFELRYDDGTLETIGHLSNGELDGKITYYNPNGKISRTSYYSCGKLHGVSVTFNENEKPTLYECHVNGDLVTKHAQGTIGFWLSRKTACLEIGIGRRLTALVLDYNICLLSISLAKFFRIDIPLIHGILLLLPIIPELIIGLSIGKKIMRISKLSTILPTKGHALRARWFVKHYPFCLLIIVSYMLTYGSIPIHISATANLRTSIALKVISLVVVGFGVFNYLCLRSTGVFFHTLASNPEIATPNQEEKVRITDLIEPGYCMKHRTILLRCMALALDMMLIQAIVGLMG